MKFLYNNFFIAIILIFNISNAKSAENIAFIDVDYVLNNSNFGIAIYKDLEKLNEENIKTLSNKEKEIKEKKEAINKTKNISSKEKLEKDIIIFNQEVEKYKIQKDKIFSDFNNKKKQKLDLFLTKINPLIQEYMKDNSIDIVLEKKQIFMGSTTKDITKDILELINEKLNNG